MSIELSDNSVPVVVLKLHHCGLGVARSLGRLGVGVYGVHDDRRSPAARSRYCRSAVEWSIDEASHDETVSFLLELGERLGGRAICIATEDVGCVFLDANAASLREQFVFPAQPPGLVRSLSSKKEMYFLCKKLGISTPEAVFPESREEVAELLHPSQLPVVVKPIDPWRIENPLESKPVVARSREEVLEAFDRMKTAVEPNVMLQEYVPGGADSVWMFNGYFDDRSECLAGFTGQKLRQYPPYTGITSLGVCRPNEVVDQTTRRFMKQVGYRGILDIGYRFDVRDGQYKLLDVNPRLGTTFRLFVDENGLDVVRALYLDLTGQLVPQPVGVDGRKWMIENYDLVSSRRYLRDGALTFGEWVRSLRGVRETAWFARDDARPFLSMCTHSLASGLGLSRAGQRARKGVAQVP